MNRYVLEAQDKKFFSYKYVLESATDIPSVVEKIEKSDHKRCVAQITSFMHNTVLVHNLKKELERLGVDITLLTHEDKKRTLLTLFCSDEAFENTKEFTAAVLLETYQTNCELAKRVMHTKKALFQKYFTDNLTNLPNVYQLRKELENEEKKRIVSIVVDDFETINSFYGYLVGDFVLEQVALFLDEQIDTTVYRISGSEFAIIVEHLDFYALKEFLQELYEKINGFTVLYQNTKITITFTLASSASNSMKNNLSKVAMALHYAKKNRLPFWIYEDSMRLENRYEQNLLYATKVRKAVEDGKIVPYFQAILENKTDKIVKYEVFARLLDENDNVIPAELFLPVAKNIKVYSLVTRTIIDKAFELFANKEVEFSINLSIDDVMDGDIYRHIIQKLKAYSKLAHLVTFELLESEAVEDFGKVKEFIKEIKRYGAKVAIDDFGSGYSNFSYLISMDADMLKIDGSLIKDIDTNNESYFVVETIVRFAKKLGIEVVAEQVHSSTVHAKVKELGIEYSQGFYIDKPDIESNTNFLQI